jgi:hypothetical protein
MRKSAPILKRTLRVENNKEAARSGSLLFEMNAESMRY